MPFCAARVPPRLMTGARLLSSPSWSSLCSPRCMTSPWGQGEPGTPPPQDTAAFYTTTFGAQWKLEEGGKKTHYTPQQRWLFKQKGLHIRNVGGGKVVCHTIWSLTRRASVITAYLQHKRAELLLFQPPDQGSRSTWLFESVLQSCSYCSTDGRQLFHTSLSSPALTLQEDHSEEKAGVLRGV